MERLGVLLALVWIIYSVSAQSLQSSGSAVKNVGENVAFSCRGSGLNLFTQELKWAKVDNRDPKLTKEISSHITTIWNADRYSVTAKQEENGDVTYNFNINNIRTQDDGTFKCFIQQGKDVITEVKESLTVRQPVKSVQLLVGGRRVDSNQPLLEQELDVWNPDLTIGCKVRGSNPAPKVMMMIGEEDITAGLKREDQANVKGPEFQSIRAFSTDLDSTGVYPLENTILNKEISCSAWLPGDSSNKMVAKALLRVKEPPKVECKNTTTIVGNHRATLECTIKSLVRPQGVSWFIDNEDNPLFVPPTNERIDEYTATITDIDANTVKVSLEIETVEERHIETIYELRAKISQHDISHAVRLRSKPRSGGSTGGQAKIAMTTGLLASVIVIGGLLKRLM